MHLTNSLTEYGLISKVLHWLSAILLLVQIPLGFYLVDLDFGEQRINIENIHVIIGLSIFHIVILRLVNKILNPTPKLNPSIFKGQVFLAKMNHILLYLAILSITVSGILKKLFNGETLIIFFKEIQIKDNFELADQFYNIHILSNYTILVLIVIHLMAVIVHRLFFKDNLLKKML
ncbi:cytochrome b/b6 domain-containing protein [Candidatus Pelagibacter ubique]|uniref:cytochrome b n=1 Tax=Pelagibacter ubique TaxID=198252 RepID=UPI0003D1C481